MGADNTQSRLAIVDASGSMAEQHQLYAYKKIKLTVTDLTGEPFVVPKEFLCRGIIVDVAGDVNLKLFRDDSFDAMTLAASVIYPMRVAEVKPGGTTATGITLLG